MSRPARGTFRQTISIHALREEGDLADLPDEQREYIISIHALREEGDDLSREVFVDELDFYPRPPRGGRLCFVDFCSRSVRFLSTPSARRATATVKDLALELVISIHALREEGDGRHLRRVIVGADISIHALREEGDACGPCRIC